MQSINSLPLGRGLGVRGNEEENMDFTFSEEHNMLRDMVRKFTTNEVKPLAAKIDKEHKVPRELINKAAELGLMGIPFPEKYGGADMGEIGYCIMLESFKGMRLYQCYTWRPCESLFNCHLS